MALLAGGWSSSFREVVSSVPNLKSLVLPACQAHCVVSAQGAVLTFNLLDVRTETAFCRQLVFCNFSLFSGKIR